MAFHHTHVDRVNFAMLGLPLGHAIFLLKVVESQDAVGTSGQTTTSARVPFYAIDVSRSGFHGKIQNLLECAQVQQLENSFRENLMRRKRRNLLSKSSASDLMCEVELVKTGNPQLIMDAGAC